jgi:hypothetical protein
MRACLRGRCRWCSERLVSTIAGAKYRGYRACPYGHGVEVQAEGGFGESAWIQNSGLTDSFFHDFPFAREVLRVELPGSGGPKRRVSL